MHRGAIEMFWYKMKFLVKRIRSEVYPRAGISMLFNPCFSNTLYYSRTWG